MELYIFNRELTFLGVIDDYFSLRWRRKYFTSGEFELHCNVNEYVMPLLQKGNLIFKKNSVECGVIESIQIEDSKETGETITVTGRFLSSYLDRRITGETVVIRDTAQNAMRYYVNIHCINPTNKDRVIPLLQLGEKITETEQIQIQATHKNVLTTLEKLAKKSAQGFRITPNFGTKKMLFEVYKGVDRSINQHERPYVIFSDEYDNTSNTMYSYDSAEHKNTCLVCATISDNTTEEQQQKKIYANVGGGVGLDRREMFLNSAESKEEETTETEFKQVLKQEGLNQLKLLEVVENFETEVDDIKSYKTNWDLGDIVTCIKKKWDKLLTARITEIEEIYENGITTIIPVLGNPSKEPIDLLKEEW